jgi:6-pyruvoyl-tetrahydropterin synthase
LQNFRISAVTIAKTNSPAPHFSSIFVRQATILDCAVMHPTRGPIGQSWWVDVEWQGELDSEGVVFDFGLAKKSAKKAIDDHFDHRLLVERQTKTVHYCFFAINKQTRFCLGSTPIRRP